MTRKELRDYCRERPDRAAKIIVDAVLEAAQRKYSARERIEDAGEPGGPADYCDKLTQHICITAFGGECQDAYDLYAAVRRCLEGMQPVAQSPWN